MIRMNNDWKKNLNGSVAVEESGTKRYSKSYITYGDYENVNWFKVREGNHRIDVVPFIGATDKFAGWPSYVKEGYASNRLSLKVHKSIGEFKDSFICPKEMFKEPCPICDEYERLTEEASRGNIDAGTKATKLKVKSRDLFVVFDHDNPDKGLQLFDVSYAFWQKEVTEALVRYSGEGAQKSPYDPDDGLIIKFWGQPSQFNNFKFNKPKAFDFEGRGGKVYGFEEVQGAYQLDKMIVIPTYADMKNSLLGIDETEEETGDIPLDSVVAETPKATKADPYEDILEVDSRPMPEEKPQKSQRELVREQAQQKLANANKCPHDGVYGKSCIEALPCCEKCDEETWNACYNVAKDSQS